MSAAEKLGELTLKLDDDMIKIIDKSVGETFNSFLSISPVLKKCYESKEFLSEKSEISGVIAFIQNTLEGTLAIRFKQNTILALLSRLYGEELTTIDNKIVGGVAELTNVIHAIAKEELNLQGYNYQMCLPVVIIGENHSVVTALSGRKMIFEYDLNGMPCTVELILH
jgi:CheY-specific phosphatase CheX